MTIGQAANERWLGRWLTGQGYTIIMSPYCTTLFVRFWSVAQHEIYIYTGGVGSAVLSVVTSSPLKRQPEHDSDGIYLTRGGGTIENKKYARYVLIIFPWPWMDVLVNDTALS